MRKAVEEQHERWLEGEQGNLLMDVPTGLSMTQLTNMALEDDKRRWRDMVRTLR